jgi:hypothetical protein
MGSIPATVTPAIVGAVLELPSPPQPKRVPLADASKFVGVFRTMDKTELHVLHTFVEAGRLWVYDEFDQRTDRLDYQGGDEFVVAHTPVRVRINAAGIETMLPDGTKIPGPRQK